MSEAILLVCYTLGETHKNALFDSTLTTYVYYYNDSIVRYTTAIDPDSPIRSHLIDFPPLGEVMDDYVALMRYGIYINSIIHRYLSRHSGNNSLGIPDDSGIESKNFAFIASYHKEYNEFFNKVLLVLERDYKLQHLLDDNN